MNTHYIVNIGLLICCIFSFGWYVYNRFIRTKDFHPFGQIQFYTPECLSCGIPYVSINPKKNNCKYVKFDGWSIVHFIIYFVCGIVVPEYYGTVFILSILCEIYEYYSGWRARFIIDPLVNMLGYYAGQKSFHIDLSMYDFFYDTNTTIILSILLVIIYYYNRPCMINKDFTVKEKENVPLD
jgi:hypothetical protein